MTTKEMTRCKNCCYLVEGDNGEWICDDWEKEIHEVSDEDCAVETEGVWTEQEWEKGENTMINLAELSDNNLIVLKGFIEREIKIRKKKENLKLIDNFKKAFYDVRDAGVHIHYECDDDIPIDDWDSFYFDD